MTKSRLEAFSDGVIAIIITIMVLELHAPHGAALADLRDTIPVFLMYALSFVYVGIYWNNHHHMLHAAREVNGRILWANLHLLFWLSLIPFTTRWVGETQFARDPVVLYGAVLLLAGVAYYVLARALIAHHGAESTLAKAIGRDVKGKASILIYATAIALAFVASWIAFALYVVVAVMWFVPDTRIERAAKAE
jgi:uncharacterized membrane protein